MGHDYFKLANETVNPANGSVSLRIQVPVPPGRRLALPFAFTYDSSGVNHVVGSAPAGHIEWSSNLGYLSQGGWGYSVPLINETPNQWIVGPPGHQLSCSYYTNYVFLDPSGSRHALQMAAVPPGHSCPFANFPTGGDDFLQATVDSSGAPVVVADADGTVYHFANPMAQIGLSGLPDYVEDRNGNQVTFTDLGQGAFNETDTLGRTAISSSGFGTSGNTVTVSGLQGAYNVYWGTASSSFSVGAVLDNAPDQYCTVFPNEGGSQPVITSILLPNDTQYTFTYDSTYGLLQQITYPNGGTVQYTWQLNGNSEYSTFDDTTGAHNACKFNYGLPALLSRTVSFDGVTQALQQTFSYQTQNWSSGNWGTKQTTVTTNDLLRGTSFTTVYNYTPVNLPVPPDTYNYTANQVPVESSVVYNDVGGTLLETDTKNWVDQYEMQGEQVKKNTTVASDQFFVFASPGGQITDKYECGSGQTCYSTAKGSTPSAYTRHTNTQDFSFAKEPEYPSTIPQQLTILDRPSSVIVYGSGGTKAAETDYVYDNSSLTPTGGLPGHDDQNYNSSWTSRGNATSKTEWQNSGGSSSEWTYAYDDTGQQMSTVDACGNTSCTDMPGSPTHTTNYTYSNDDAYLASITYPPTNGVVHGVSFTYYLPDGQLASSTDENGNTTTYAYWQWGDQLDRLTYITYPDGGMTEYSYTGVCGQPTWTMVELSSGSYYQETATMDGFCHETQKAVTKDPQGIDTINTAYDGLGRVWTVSNPFRTGDLTQGSTTYSYDALGRTTSVQYNDKSTATTSYSGLCWTPTDPAGIARTLCNDNLGRLHTVKELALNATTTYGYDLLDDLTTVSQSGQPRTFLYDWLKRLTSAANPESGTTSYTYDANGNVQTRTDARSITTTYAYDAINRVTSKSYSDGTTPAANFAYDETTVTLGTWTSPTLNNPIGRLTHTSTGTTPITATVQDYDLLGRTQNYWQCTPVNCGTSSIWAAYYGYDLAGDVTSWNHPAGFTISQPVDKARHIMQVTSTLSDATHPATLAFGAGPNSSITYTAWGAVSQLEVGCVNTGCNLADSYFYNTRLQMAVAELGTTTTRAADSCRVYNFYVGQANASACSESASNWPTGTNNNGDVAGYYYNDIANSGLSHVATYTYDGVNRLKTAVATGNITYNQTFAYTADGSASLYGNMTCTASPSEAECLAPTYSSTTNRITTSGYTYDNAGDVTGDGTNTYTWDAEGHMTSVLNSGVAIANNTYNALGQLVLDAPRGTSTQEIYGADGSLLWRYTGSSTDPNQRAFVPFEGRILAEYYGGSPTGTLFDHPDELGSLTASTLYNGTGCQEMVFYPFGQRFTGAGSCNMHQVFAQLPDFDPAIDEYNTANRHYTPMGRWMSPDPGGTKVWRPDDPQTWNMYAYAHNNPTTLTDPSGLKECGGANTACDKKPSANDSGVTTLNQNQTKYDPSTNGPEDPTNPGKPLYQNRVVKDASDKAFEKTTNGTARDGLAEAGGAIDYKDGKITIVNEVNSVHSDGKANEMGITTDDKTIAIFHTHGNSALATPSDTDKKSPMPNFVRSQSALYVTVPGTNTYIKLSPPSN